MGPLFKKNKMGLVVFAAPLLALYLLIIVIPLVQSLIYSFTEWDGVNAALFNGLDNYKRLFSSRDLRISIRNSILFSIVLTLYQVGLGAVFAFLLANSRVRFKHFFRDIYFFPVLLSVSVVSQLWISIFHGDFGLINQTAKAIGLSWEQNWLVEPVKGLIAVAFVESWKGMGYHMLIIYAAMKNIPENYYEAARIDGANKLQQLWSITLPLSAPTLKMCIIMCITFGFRAFEIIFLMTSGGPGNYTYTLPVMLYKAMFNLRSYGYGSSIAVMIMVICVGLMLTINRLSRRFEENY